MPDQLTVALRKYIILRIEFSMTFVVPCENTHTQSLNAEFLQLLHRLSIKLKELRSS